MRGGDLIAPFHGARRRLDDLAREQAECDAITGPMSLSRRTALAVKGRALAYASVMPKGAFLCGRTAAAIRALPVRHGEELEFGVLAPQRAPRASGIRGRKIEPHLVGLEVFDGLPISTPATTWAMLGRDLSLRELIVLADAMLFIPRDSFARRHPELAIATRDELQAALDAGRRAGIARLTQALALSVTGSASPLETDYRLDAAAAGLPVPALDVEIRDERGRLLGVSEIVYEKYRVAVEIEGDHHRTSVAQWNRDIDKVRAYMNAGWHVERLTGAHVRRQRNGVAIVREALVRRGWRPGR